MKKYGRPPKKNEVIHHLDENTWNNHHSNLIYLPKGMHMWFHRWALSGAIKKYAYEIEQVVDYFGPKSTEELIAKYRKEDKSAKAKD